MSNGLPIPIPQDFLPLLEEHWPDNKEVKKARDANDARLLQLPLYQSTSFSARTIISLIDNTITAEDRSRLEKQARHELVRQDLYTKLCHLLK